MDYGLISYEDELAKDLLRQYKVVYQYIGRFEEFSAKFGDTYSKIFGYYDLELFTQGVPAGWQIRECLVFYVPDR
ncbi:MAG: hypothetical protein KGL39_38385 [Patescibacteria group bacterium]|nr:hypothetical protein [Patescibacteria group bacterium]